MSVIVKGMEMPKKCLDCKMLNFDDCCVLQSDEQNEMAETWSDLKENCPLIELPPHGRLIDADVLKQSAHLDGQLKTYIDTWIDSHATVIEAEGETDGR